MIDDTIAFPLMTEGLLGAVAAELEEAGLPSLCFIGALPGAVAAMDYCGNSGKCGGMLWIRLGASFPSTEFPLMDQMPATTPTLFAVELSIGVLRGAPDFDGRNLPTVTDQLEAVRVQTADMAAIRRAICKYLGSIERDYVLGLYTPLGPEGGCVGGTWSVTVHQDF